MQDLKTSKSSNPNLDPFFYGEDPSTQKVNLSFLKGLMCLPLGIKEILSDYKIFVYSIIPILLGVAFIYFGFYYGWDWSTEIVKNLVTRLLSQWFAEDGYIFKFIFSMFNFVAKILFTVFAIYLGFIAIQIISIPFYSLSCEQVLMKRGVFPARDFRLAAWIRLNVRLLIISLIRMLIFLVFGIVVFILSFIPGLQLLAMIYSGYVMALDSMDYTLELYEMSLGRRMGIYFGEKGFFLGLGLVLLPSLFIPGLTLVLLPITVVGSAVCFADIKGKREYETLIT